MCLCRKYKVGRVNIDENHALQSRFGVKYLPMVLLINKGDTYLYSGMDYCVISILFIYNILSNTVRRLFDVYGYSSIRYGRIQNF